MKHKQPIDAPAGALPLDQAMREFVPAELWTEYREAAERCIGLPPPMWLPPHNERASTVNAQTNYTLKMRKKKAAAWKRIIISFRSMLWDGSLIAYGRQNVLGELVPVPPHAWRYLAWKNAETGTVAGGGITFYDLRVARSPPACPSNTVDWSNRDAEGGRAPEDRKIARNGEVETAREGFPCEAPLRIAVDELTKTVTFLDMGMFAGKNFQLIRLLWQMAKEDLVEGRMPENNRYLAADELARLLEIEEPTMRRRVSDCRSKFTQMYLGKCGKKPPEDMLIENKHGRGYRMNPAIRIVAPTELQ